jgi:hypothetical protein
VPKIGENGQETERHVRLEYKTIFRIRSSTQASHYGQFEIISVTSAVNRKSFKVARNLFHQKMPNFANSAGPFSAISNFSRKIRHGSSYQLWICANNY